MFISDGTLRAIHLVAKHQGITTVAEQLNKVPSTISYTIRRAKESLGVRLLTCKERYIELSPTGSCFIEHSRTILGDLEALKHNAVLIHDGIEHRLMIAVNNIIPGDLLVISIRDFERQLASTTLAADLEIYNGCWGVLYSKRADLVYGTPHAVPSGEGIISEPVRQMEWDFVVNPLHPLAAKRHPLKSNELCHYPVVYIHGTSVSFPPVQVWLLEEQRPIFASDFVTTVALIERGVDVGYIPHHLALPLLNSGKLLKRPMHKHKHATKLFLAIRSDSMGKAYQWCIKYPRNPQLMTQFVFN